MPPDKAQAMQDHLEKYCKEWYSPEAVRERGVTYLEKLAEQPPKFVDYNKERNNLFAGLRAMYEKPMDWQEQLVDWMCAIYFGTYAETPLATNKGILVVGPTGIGKTDVFEYLQKHPLIKFRIRTAYEIKKLAEGGGTLALEDIKRAKYLLIDDLGIEGTVIYMGNVIHPIQEILHYRSENNLMTHITMNKGAANHYDGRARDRMKGLCNILSLPDSLPSFR